MFYIILVITLVIYTVNFRLKRLVSLNGYKIYDTGEKRVIRFQWKYLLCDPEVNNFIVSDMNVQNLEFIGKKLSHMKLIIICEHLKTGNLGCFEHQYSHPYDRVDFRFKYFLRRFPLLTLLMPAKTKNFNDFLVPRVISYFERFYPNIYLFVGKA